MGGRARGAGPAVGGISAGGTRRSPWRPSEIPVRRRGPRPESLRSFEYLHQPSFIALLYGRDPGLFVDQIEDVDHQGPSGGVEIDPQGTRGRRDDDRKRRESMRRPHVAWNDHEPGKHVLPARAENAFPPGHAPSAAVPKPTEKQ